MVKGLLKVAAYRYQCPSQIRTDSLSVGRVLSPLCLLIASSGAFHDQFYISGVNRTEDSGHKMMPWVLTTIRLGLFKHTKLGA